MDNIFKKWLENQAELPNEERSLAYKALLSVHGDPGLNPMPLGFGGPGRIIATKALSVLKEAKGPSQEAVDLFNHLYNKAKDAGVSGVRIPGNLPTGMTNDTAKGLLDELAQHPNFQFDKGMIAQATGTRATSVQRALADKIGGWWSFYRHKWD